MSIGLHPTAGASSAALPRAGAGGAGPLAPQERVTLSADARRASRALPPPPASPVRWYRAPRLVRSAPPAPAPRRTPSLHAAVAAYLRQASAAA